MAHAFSKAVLATSLLMAASSVHAFELADQLALDPLTNSPTTRPTTRPAAEPLLDLTRTAADLSVEMDLARSARPRISGVELQGFHNITSLAYRASTGTGLGLATMPGLTLTQGFVTSGGLRVSFYYVLPIGEFADPTRPAAYDNPQEVPDSAVGLRIGWRF